MESQVIDVRREPDYVAFDCGVWEGEEGSIIISREPHGREVAYAKANSGATLIVMRARRGRLLKVVRRIQEER
jgi:hypothetical protein